ncbi:MAG: TolC family protein [Chthoniobacteraceae bacterium]
MTLRPSLALALFAAGCVSFESRPISPATTARDFDGRTLADSGLRAFLASHGATAKRWDLDELTLATLYFQPDLEVARARHEAAAAAVGTAGERPNPTLSWSPAYNATSTGVTPWIMGFSLDVPIETGGKRGWRQAQARQKSEAARMRVAAEAWQVRSRVRAALVALESARLLDAAVREQESVQAETVRLLDLERGAGAISPLEVTRARVALDNARLSHADAQAAMTDARHQLATAIGIPEHALAAVDVRFARFERAPAVPTRAARRQAAQNRPDLLAALADYAASESALALTVAKQYPDIHLSPGFTLDQNENKWALPGLTFEMPLLNQHRGAIREAEAQRKESAATFIAQQAKVIGEVDRAVASYLAAMTKLQLVNELRAKLERQTVSVKAQLDAGNVAKIELVTAQLELTTNRLARIDALTKIQQALGRLEDAMQSPAQLPESAWAAKK